MQSIRKRSGVLLIGLTLALAALIAPLGLVLPAHAETPRSGEHLITIHDRGQERNVITKQDTLRNVFKEIGVLVDPNDIVEPGLDTKLQTTSYQVNVYRARPVTVVDGVYQTRIMTAYQTPKQIAKAANITLRDEDQQTLSMSDDLINDGASLVMTIKRATPVNLVLYGTPEQVYTQAKTVGDFMKEKNLKLGSQDGMNLSSQTAIVPGIVVSIWRDGVQTQTRDEDVPFTTREIQDATQPVGYRNVTTPGANGKKAVTYQVNIRNGQEISRQVLQSVVLNQASEEVIVVGTKISLPAGSHEDWMAEAGISPSDYGYVNAIFAQESGWNPAARNPVGYVGLGQTSEKNLSRACPNWQSDPICQIKFFDGYKNRYGSWQEAYYFKFGHPGQRDGHGWW